MARRYKPGESCPQSGQYRDTGNGVTVIVHKGEVFPEVSQPAAGFIFIYPIQEGEASRRPA